MDSLLNYFEPFGPKKVLHSLNSRQCISVSPATDVLHMRDMQWGFIDSLIHLNPTDLCVVACLMINPLVWTLNVQREILAKFHFHACFTRHAHQRSYQLCYDAFHRCNFLTMMTLFKPLYPIIPTAFEPEAIGSFLISFPKCRVWSDKQHSQSSLWREVVPRLYQPSLQIFRIECSALPTLTF